MAEENLNKGFVNTFKRWFGKVNQKAVLPIGMITEQSRGELNKALEPKFLFKPPFGYPRNVNLFEIRRLAATPYVEMCISTIIDEVAAVEWNIIVSEDFDAESKKAEIEHVEKFFDNPNTNKESFEKILRKVVRDILEVDSGIIVKQFNLKEEMVGIVAKDGATFTKNPDIFGMFTDREELLIDAQILRTQQERNNFASGGVSLSFTEARTQAAYFQYGWVTGIKPIPFGKREIIWLERHPRTDQFYGRSPMEILADAVQVLIYGIEDNLKYFSDNNIPRGVLGLEDSDADAIKGFEQMWEEKTRERDIVGNWRRKPFQMPVINKKPTFTRIQFTNAELELIAQQKWFSKMVWASFGVTATELGYTEDAKGMANQIVQSQVFKKRAINPMLRLLEFHLNKEIISEFDYEGIEFKFNLFDVEEERKKADLYEVQLNTFRTVNEIRKEEGLEEVEDGDKVKGAVSENTFNFNNPMDDPREQAGMQGQGKPPEKQEKPKKEDKALSTAQAISSPLFPREGEGLEMRIKKHMRDNKKKVIALLEKEEGQQQIAKLKDTREVVRFLETLLTFEGLKELSDNTVREMFQKGWDKSEETLNRNVMMNQEVVEVLKDHTFSNIQGMTDEIVDDLRQELQRGFINTESLTQLKERVTKVFDVGEDRAVMIARTETNRAENQGSLQAMKRSGETMTKTWLTHKDDRTSAICNRLDGQTVGLNEKFKDNATGQIFDSPPSHVNCRSSMTFDFEDEKEDETAETKDSQRPIVLKLDSSREKDDGDVLLQEKNMEILKKKEALIDKLEADLNG